jgi:ribosome-associated protein
LNSREQALAVAAALDDAKGVDIQVLDVSEISGFADCFVIATGTSDRHVRTLTERALEALQHTGADRPRVEGRETSRWVLVDAFDVIVHLFQADARDFYGLERLWGEAREIERERRAAGASASL